MKLSEYLNSKLGQTLTQDDITAISTEVDVIKARATDKLTEELAEVKGQLETSTTELGVFKTEKSDAELRKAFIENGGNPDKFTSFKKIAGDVSEVAEYDFQSTFDEFGSLKAETTPEFSGRDITQVGGSDGDDDEGNYSLIA